MRQIFSPPVSLSIFPRTPSQGPGLAHRLYLAFEFRDEASI